MSRKRKQLATLIIALAVLTFSPPQATGEVVFSTFTANDGFSAGPLGLNVFTDIAVSFAPEDLDPLALGHSSSEPGGSWIVIPNAPKPAFDVNGAATAAPSNCCRRPPALGSYRS